MRRCCDSKSTQHLLAMPTILTSPRYLSQVRQELAMRLLARVYADGNTPSKVSVPVNPLPSEINIYHVIVVVEFYEA